MPAGITYEEIVSQTLTSAASSVTFSSIPTSYTDLVLVCSTRSTASSGDDYAWIYLNGDTTASNYSRTLLVGDGSSVNSNRFANLISLTMPSASTSSGVYNVEILNFQNYKNSTTFKTVLSRNSLATVGTYAQVGLWRNTSIINTIQLVPYFGPNFAAGSTFALYGIAAA